MSHDRIIALFTLKPGVEAAVYEAWAQARDMPTVRGLPSIAGFDVFAATGVLGEGTPPYDYVEIIDVADMAAFGADVASATMQAIAAEFAAMADVVFLTTRRL
jgi:hypothetical protein